MTSLALTDRFGRAHDYLRISLTDRCNLRCRYCMPEEGMVFAPAPSLLNDDEIIRLATIFTRLGVRKIRLTGGEPLLRKNIDRIIQTLRRLPGLGVLAMTTNGLQLAECAHTLRESGLTTLTISLDTLQPGRFIKIARRNRFADVMAGIRAALESGFAPLKINIVVMRGVNDDEIVDFVEWGKDKPVDLRFIEYMPFPGNQWQEAGLVPYRDMRKAIEEKFSLIPLVTESSAVGRSFRLEHHTGLVSFVTSMSESFCASCSRLRLTADGEIKSCLFHPAERSLRDIMRDGGNDDAIIDAIAAALNEKPMAHPPMAELLSVKNRSMIAIGG